MRAFYHPSQAAHDPQQFMRYGRIVPPKDRPERTDKLLGALDRLGIPVTAPQGDDAAARLAVHTEGFLAYLASAWDRWQDLPDPGPEVWPNTFPYWSGRPEQRARPECPATHLIAQTGWYLGDMSVSMGKDTWLSIRESCNTAVAAADAVAAHGGSAYALCRPSGHHARADRASGFCFLNNTAIAAERLRRSFDRVAVLDVDAHHGDGTQQIFYSRPDVLTISIHADPVNYYPFFTGYEAERGIGAGEGSNVNLPLAHGSSGSEMLRALDRASKAITAFRPGVLVVALGFDAHVLDPIGVLKLEAQDFGVIGARIKAFELPTLIVQEGGYALDDIGACLEEFLAAAQ
ncbi:MAG TPA: histone deacetylase family protein [Vicinamibacterales bacterium]|nr:histone deacetylase family protein [Vicinamibacterales bacterium]